MIPLSVSRPVSRRRLVGWLGAASALSLAMPFRAQAMTYPVRHTNEEWKRLLTSAQYHILREQGTEWPFTSALLHEQRHGTFVCAADGNALFSSAAKYDSGTGWPSFWKPLAGGIGTARDASLGYTRTEVHCARCGGHLGHVFDDGPRPTGLRYCMNGDGMKFRAS